jgi:hypothetical protein
MDGLGSNHRTRDGKNGQGKRAEEKRKTGGDVTTEQISSEPNSMMRKTFDVIRKTLVYSTIGTAVVDSTIRTASAKGLPYDDANALSRRDDPRSQSDRRYAELPDPSYGYSNGRGRGGDSSHQRKRGYAELPGSSYDDANALNRRGEPRSQSDRRYAELPDPSYGYSNGRGRGGDSPHQRKRGYAELSGSSYGDANGRGWRGEPRSQSDGRYTELSGPSERRRGPRHSDYPSQYTSRDYDGFSPTIQIGNREYVKPTIEDINTLLQDKHFPKFMEKVCQSPEVLANLLKNSNFRDSLSPMFYDKNIQMYFQDEVCKDPKRQQMLLNTHKKIIGKFSSDWKVPTLVGTSAIAILSTAAFLYFNRNKRGKSTERQNLQQQQGHRQDARNEIEIERELQETNHNYNQFRQKNVMKDRDSQPYRFVKNRQDAIIEELSDDDAQDNQLDIYRRHKDSDKSMISYSRPRRQDNNSPQRSNDSLQEIPLTNPHNNQLDSYSNRLHESEKIKEVAQMLSNMFASSVVDGKGAFKFFDEDEVRHVDGRVETRRQGIAFNFERLQESIINQEESKFDAKKIKPVERELNVQEKKKMHETFVNSPCGSQIRAQMNEFGSVPLFKALLETRGKGFTSRSHIFNNAYVLSFFMNDKEVQKFLAKKEESQPYWDVINRDLRLYDWNYTEFVCAKQQGKRLLQAEREMSRKD